MKSKLFLAAGLILLLGGLIGYKMWNKPHMDISAAESFISVSAMELVQAFKEDETSANTRF